MGADWFQCLAILDPHVGVLGWAVFRWSWTKALLAAVSKLHGADLVKAPNRRRKKIERFFSRRRQFLFLQKLRPTFSSGCPRRSVPFFCDLQRNMRCKVAYIGEKLPQHHVFLRKFCDPFGFSFFSCWETYLFFYFLMARNMAPEHLLFLSMRILIHTESQAETVSFQVFPSVRNNLSHIPRFKIKNLNPWMISDPRFFVHRLVKRLAVVPVLRFGPSLLRGELCPGARGQERCAAGGPP